MTHEVPPVTPIPIPTVNSQEETRRAGPRAWAGLALLSLPTVMLGLDLTLLHLTLPALAAGLLHIRRHLAVCQSDRVRPPRKTQSD